MRRGRKGEISFGCIFTSGNNLYNLLCAAPDAWSEDMWQANLATTELNGR